jgi:hypothetical protein
MYKKFLILLLLVLVSCQFAPKKSDYDAAECFNFADCSYRNKVQAAVCNPLAEACRDAHKEIRISQRITFCKSNPIEGWTQNECRLYLNQK